MRERRWWFLFRFCLFFWPFFWFACSTGSVEKPLTLSDQVAKDALLEDSILERFEPSLVKDKKLDVASMLNQVATLLHDNHPGLSKITLEVIPIEDGDFVWQNFTIPGGRIYLSRGLLRSLEFENELAAVMAFELGHILNRHVARKLYFQEEQKQQKVDEFFSKKPLVSSDPLNYTRPGGAFYYTEDQIKQSIFSAVEILYKAGYDSRGVVSLWKIYKQNIDHSPYREPLLNQMMDWSYEAVALYSPLRNPRVQSNDFTKFLRKVRGA